MKKSAKKLSWFTAGKIVVANNKMQKNYKYKLTYSAGKKLRCGVDGVRYPNFKPKYTPQQMLRMGVFEGKYCNDQTNEYPKEWFLTTRGKFNHKKFSIVKANVDCNYFKVKSRLSLQEWRRKKWVPVHKSDKDLRGWFEWYCRYWLGRRNNDVDVIQIKRWRSFNRHYAQFLKNTKGKGNHIHPKRRQALIQWSYPCKD